MATVETLNNKETSPRPDVDATFTARSDAVQDASEASFPASDPSACTPVTGVGASLRDHVLRQCGRFALLRGPHGFCWSLTSREGFVWYWHSQVQLWIASRHSHSTIQEATAGLDGLLASELAESLEEQPEALQPGLSR